MGKNKKKEFDPANLPAMVYVKLEEDGDSSYLIVSEDFDTEEDGVIIGTYYLEIIGTVKAKRTLTY